MSDALIKVYLPVLFLFPTYYHYEIPHVLRISAVDATLIPIGFVTLVRYGKYWRWQRADLWLFLFAVGAGISEAVDYSNALRTFVEFALGLFLPYIVGKLLIEQEGIRERVVRRIVWLTAIVSFLSVFEFRLSRNLFTAFYTSVFGSGSPNIEQIRGYTRVQGPYGHAILAGMVFSTVLVFSLWLGYRDRMLGGPGEKRIFGVRLNTLLAGCALLGLFMSNSRGPWLGAALALLITRIGPARNVRSAVVVVLLICLILGGAGYVYFDAYTSGNIDNALSQDQENAMYRRALIESYEPIAQAGGMFGWGITFAHVPGQGSIDNDYLLLQLVQGWFGLWTFIVLGAEGCFAVLLKAKRAQDRTDFYFAIALLAIQLAIFLDITTVFLGGQPEALLYLCIGWSLATWTPLAGAATTMEEPGVELSRPRIFA